MITVRETPTFIQQAEKLLTPEELDDLLFALSADPTAGDIIKDTGGVRKLRFQAKSKGKRGGSRVIYFYFDDNVPLTALFIYGKNQQDDLSPETKKMVKNMAEQIKKKARQTDE
ncbi:toxin HigB-2 (plasmid) [Maritalea myrionectae]|uniref:Toxin HigB-2 n=1 Tax=Maritalea myrionectae TaxID=454601 RepID=A0A2R4MJ96_9HYPH|nr:type II toxin-antitoxin system RelE/ParE family toxin [Maritalea myrionectae]AVX05996.1 toxin HigB-2 [Maritalea myrionectae]